MKLHCMALSCRSLTEKNVEADLRLIEIEAELSYQFMRRAYQPQYIMMRSICCEKVHSSFTTGPILI